MKWGGELANRYPVREITPFTPDFHNITIRDIEIEHCSRFISAVGLPERPLRHVLISNGNVRTEELGVMRDVEDFVIEKITFGK